MSASERLERLLYILPVAAREDGATIDELARALNVSRETVLHDLEEATARAYYHPAGFVEEFSIYIEGDVVRVHAPAEFQRPARLSPREALALGLGLRALAAEAEADKRAQILAFAARLEHELAAPQYEMQPRLQEAEPSFAMMKTVEPLDVQLGEDELRGELSDAIADQFVCRIRYLSPTAREPVEREIKPIRLLYATGHWYVAALVAGSDEPRIYRLDRILALTTTRTRFRAPLAPAIVAPFSARGQAPASVRVRYSPRIARWIAEERDDVVVKEDGAVVLTHLVSDPDWLVRHVLQYGGEAVVETEEYRALVARTARALIGSS